MKSSQSSQKPAISETKKIGSQIARRKRVTIMGFTMVAVVIPFCLYYLFFVTTQTAYFSKRNFRVLAGIGEHMSSKIDNLATNLANVAKKVSDRRKVEDKSKSDIKKVEGKQATKPAGGGDDAQKVKEAANVVPDFKLAPVQYEQVQMTGTGRGLLVKTPPPISKGNSASSNQNASLPAGNTNARSPVRASKKQPAKTSATPAAAGSEPRATLSVSAEQGSFWLLLEHRAASSALPGNVSVKKDINALFEPFVSRYVIDEQNETKERLFDEVLVAEQETGRVIFQLGPAGLSVVTLDSLLNNKGTKLELKLADQSSTLADVQIAGADYKLFLQPVRLTLSAGTDDKEQGVRWVVCGLTRTDHFRDETFAVSYTVLIIFVFAVLLAVLSWPLLKLKLMGPKDRLRRADFALTLFSALMGTALVTLIVLHLHTHLSLNDALDDHLTRLSKRIESNFQDELGSALEQLRQLNVQIEKVPPKEQSVAMKELEDSKAKQPAENPAPKGVSRKPRSSGAKSTAGSPLSLSERRDLLTDNLNWAEAPYPYFNNATWTDPKGQQRIKWTTKTDTTTFVDVSIRQFFKDARNNNTWKLKRNGKDFEYSFELINSKVTGENVAIIATRVPNSPWVSNLDTRLVSLMGTVLPVGYGYAVIDSSGKVHFHSDEVKNLEEQFFAECENDRWLRAAVLARTNRLIDTSYLGRGHRMYVSPLAGTPWTLVTFVDRRLSRTINLQVITLSIALYLLFASLVVALISLVILLRMIPVFSGRYRPTQGDGFRWLWPDWERASHYGLLIMSYALIAGIFVVMLKAASGWLLALCCTVLPLLAAVLWWLILIANPPPRAVEAAITRLSTMKIIATLVTGRLSYRTRYTIAFAGFLALVSILPAAGFFQIAHAFEMRLMVKHGQASIARSLEQRNERITSQYASIKIGKQDEDANERQGQFSLPGSKERAAFLEQRLEPSPGKKTNPDVYDSFFFGTTRVDLSQASLDDEPSALLGRLLLEIRPFYNQSCVESQGLAAGESSDGQWRWKLDREGHIFLGKDKDGRYGEPSVALMSGIPTIVGPNSFWSLLRVILSVALVVLLPYGLVRFIARRFFLLDLDLPPRIDVQRTTDLTGFYILLRAPTAANGHKWNKKMYCDLSSVKYWPAWTREMTSDTLKSGRCVVLDNFEHCMDDPAASREKLLTIEHLLKGGRSVVVVSTVDPSSFSLPPPAAQVAADNGKVNNYPPEPLAIKEKENGAADVDAQAPELQQTGIEARWAALFASLATAFAPDSSSPEFVIAHPEFEGILKTKAPWRYIVEIGRGIVERGTLQGKNSGDRAKIEEVISQMAEQARSYHQALWDTCTEGQRCTLVQLAQDGMLSPKNKHLRRLVKRGLIVRDPALRLMDETFRRFIKSVSHEQDIEVWRQQEGGSAWQMLRAPLLLILVGVALFLFITQKDVFDSTLSIVSGITAGIATLFRLLGMFQGKDKGAAIQG